MQVIETECYLYDFLRNPVQRLSRSSFRKGSYHYLILPVSHRMARIHKIPVRMVPVYNNMIDCTIGEFIEKNVVHLDKYKLLRTLRSIVQKGLADIEPPLKHR